MKKGKGESGGRGRKGNEKRLCLYMLIKKKEGGKKERKINLKKNSKPWPTRVLFLIPTKVSLLLLGVMQKTGGLVDQSRQTFCEDHFRFERVHAFFVIVYCYNKL